MYVVTASDGSPAFPPGMQKRDLRRNQSDLTFNTYIMSFICYAMYLPLVIVAMGMGMERWRRKGANVRRRTSRGASLIPGSKSITVRGVLEKS